MCIIFQAIFSSIITAISLPNELYHFGMPLFAFMCMAPLYFAMLKCKSYLQSALCFGVQTGLVHVLSSFWLGNFSDYAIFTLGASGIGTAFIGFCFGAYTHFLINHCNYRQRPFVFSCIIIVYEYAKSTGFLAYPWGTLSMAAYPFIAIMQVSSLTGQWGVSFLFALTGSVVGECAFSFNQRKRRLSLLIISAITLLLLMLSFIYGAYKLQNKSKVLSYINTVVVQHNAMPFGAKYEEETLLQAMLLTQEGVSDFVEEGLSTDLVLWSEGTLKHRMPKSEKLYSIFPEAMPLFTFIKDMNIPFIIGGSYEVLPKEKRASNVALFFDDTGSFNSYYAKTHLVPFAESIPFSNIPKVRQTIADVTGFGPGWIAGDKFNMFQIKQAKIATPICFEDAFDEVCSAFYKEGAVAFFNITNDSWSLTQSAEYQHFVLAAYRAIQYRIAMVRSCQSGFTVLVDCNGKILQQLPVFVPAVMAARVPVYERNFTLYYLMGNYFVYMCFAVLFMCIFCKRMIDNSLSL